MIDKYPDTWARVKIEEILAPRDTGNVLQQGWSPRCERFPSEDDSKWGVLKTTAIQEGNYLPEYNKQLPSHLESKPNIEVVKGDILLTCAGPRIRCGVACLVRETRPKLMMSGKMYRFRPVDKYIDSRYLEAFLHTQEAKHAIDKMKTGISDSGLNLTHDRFKKLLIPVAPRNEQLRIIEKIEEIFSELDKGVESLKTARYQLKVYQQALLKHAYEGKLTEKWRNDNADKLESADKLLETMRQVRKTRYQQQMDKWNAAVKKWVLGNKEGKKPVKPKNIKEMSSVDEQEKKKLPKLPAGWDYQRLGEYIESIEAGKSFKCDEREPGKDEIGVAKVSAVTWGEYKESESKTCVDLNKVNPDYFINESDFIFSRANTIELVGACVMAKRVTKKIMLSDKTLRVNFEDINRHYMLHYLRSMIGRREIMSRSTGNQDSMRNIGQDRIRSIYVPMCSRVEMEIVVQKIDEQITVIEDQMHVIDISLRKSDALRQSVLKVAFSGTFVAQNSNDEPASELLKRIAIEKAEIEAKINAAKVAVKEVTSKAKTNTKDAIKRKVSEKVMKV